MIQSSKITAAIMQANPARRTKQKYLPTQVFSINNPLKPMNPAHCRSLIDLGAGDAHSAEKENAHFASVASNQDSKATSGHKFFVTGAANNGSRQPLGQHKNISNIAKILLSAPSSTIKVKQNEPKAHIDHDNENTFNRNKNGGNARSRNQAPPHPSKQARSEARTVSEVKQLCRQVESKGKLSSVQRQKSQKSLSKLPVRPSPAQADDYSLLIKLKQYIEELKKNEHQHLARIRDLEDQNDKLKKQLVLLGDKVQVHQIRQKEMIKKIKYLQSEINRGSKPECQEHNLIIQSLKNVINQQMAKIINYERLKVQMQEGKDRNARHNSASKKQIWSNYKNFEAPEQPDSKDSHEVYSFKKRRDLSQSSIYIEEQEEQAPCRDHGRSNQEWVENTLKSKQSKASYSNIPEPYNELIKCLRSDSRASKKISEAKPSRRDSNSEDSSSRSEPRETDRLIEYQNTKDGGCEEDEILQEVGQYLSYIRNNVRQG